MIPSLGFGGITLGTSVVPVKQIEDTAELDLGTQVLARGGNPDPTSPRWERYCHLILCTNEFLYLD